MMELVMLVLLLLVVQIDAYRNFSPISRSSVLKMAAEDAADRARLTLVIAGPSIGNALFRAELKKELTFFRGAFMIGMTTQRLQLTIYYFRLFGTVLAKF